MLTDTDYQAIADRLGCGLPNIKAVAQVESSGETFWIIDGKPRPPVRFEAHHFGRLTGYRFNASHPNLSCVEWTPSLAATSHLGAWAQVEAARQLDETAAFQATSWGAFQVMGFNWKDLKYDSVQEMVAEMYTEAGQLEAFARYIEADSALKADLAIGAWRDFARRYNGPGAIDAYEAKMTAAFAAAGGQ